MSNAALLSAAASIALIAGGVSAASGTTMRGLAASSTTHRSKGTKVLYNQNSNGTGIATVSSNFTNYATNYDCAAADDFVVPQGHTWKIAEVDVTGLYFGGSAADSENVTFFKDRRGKPGRIVEALNKQNGIGGDGSFIFYLPKKVRLKPGTYWLSVVANFVFAEGEGEWGLEMNGTIHGRPAMWENPGGGFGVCPTWGTIGSCLGYTGDLMFDLQGRG